MSYKLLLVEDEIELQQNIKDILELYDFEVIIAANGIIALDQLMNHEFDLVVSDIMMPEMDGFELLSKVRNNKRLINLPFLFLSAKVEKEDLRRGMEYGAEDYLTKPVHGKDLVKAINIAITKKKSREVWLQEKIEEVLKDERNVKYHELRTPLFGIMSVLELLTTSLDSFDYLQLKDLLDNAYLASKRLNNSLLNLARFNNLSNYHPKKIEIPSFLEILEKYTGAENIKCEYKVKEDFSLEFDLEVLNFILSEVVINALKFSKEFPIEIKVTPNKLCILNFQNIIKSPQEFKIMAFGQVNRKYNEQQGLGLGLFLSEHYALKNGSILNASIIEDLRFKLEIDFKAL